MRDQQLQVGFLKTTRSMKTLEFLYQETEIHFLVNPLDKHVMVNATEMAKLFDKRVDHFTKTDHAKAFIKVMENNINQTPNGGRIIENRGRNGIYFDRRLALKFAAWLSPEFEYWIYSTIDTIVFGNYKKHWEAHITQEEAKAKMEKLKQQMLLKPSLEITRAYFEAEKVVNTAKNTKLSAIRNQYKMFDS